MHSCWSETERKGYFGAEDGGGGVDVGYVYEDPGTDFVAVVGFFVVVEAGWREKESAGGG